MNNQEGKSFSGSKPGVDLYMPLSVWLELWLLSFKLCERSPIITKTFQQLCKIQKDLHMCVQTVEQPKAEKVFSSFIFRNMFLQEDIRLTRQDVLFLKHEMCTISACFFSSLKNQNKSILPQVPNCLPESRDTHTVLQQHSSA